MASDQNDGERVPIKSASGASSGEFDGDLNRFIKEYKRWLKTCMRLNDYGKDTSRMSNVTMEAFRNDPSLGFFRGAYRNREPSYLAFDAHLERGPSTLFVTNASVSDTLLLLVDLDNKDGTGRAGDAAAYLGGLQPPQRGSLRSEGHRFNGRKLHFHFSLGQVRKKQRHSDPLNSESAWA
jgi:hypothetical protein